jgi:hypothetical protein
LRIFIVNAVIRNFPGAASSKSLCLQFGLDDDVMNLFLRCGLRCSLGVLTFTSSLMPKAQSQSSEAASGRKAVMIELFTSEGCSSCPPADAVLQRLLAQQPVPGVEIIAVEEHVDYWNHDGWADPYSSRAWTQRQEAYAALLKTDPYTPELVVDGQNQMVGSREQDVLRKIALAAKTAKAVVKIDPKNSGTPDARRFKISIDQLQSNREVADVWLAVTEDGLHSQVSGGENDGRLLNHVATLRSLRKIGVVEPGSAPFAKEADVKFDPHWKAGHLRITVFVQRRKSLEIIGAATTKFGELTSAVDVVR